MVLAEDILGNESFLMMVMMLIMVPMRNSRVWLNMQCFTHILLFYRRCLLRAAII